jgi:ubiquitin-protein ligase
MKGNVRLQREVKKAQRDYMSQIKKHGKIMDNFVCAPDPEDLLKWYFIIYGLDGDYEGGYYMGVLTCPTDFPAHAPNVKMLVETGIY